MSKKLGFWPVFALVTGSQIGTGILMLPASLAPFGTYSIIGWLISACGAISLALMFSLLCSKYPQTGGPHVYVQKAFGPSMAFFTGWTYWVISWVSTTAVVISAIGYLSPLIGNQPTIVYLTLEILLLLAITLLNLKGITVAGKVEFGLTILKFVPLLIVAVAALYRFDLSNFTIDVSTANSSLSQILGKVTLLTFWCFIGVEAATTPAGSVINPSKTIPKAILLGTLSVALFYLINSIGVMGAIPGTTLIQSNAPYADAVQLIFRGKWYLLISVIASIICIGTLNAWVLTSSQIVLGLAENGLMPELFAKKNNNEAPFWGLILSCIGILPLLIITADDNLAKQVTNIIDISVISFLFVYLICSISFLKLLIGVRPTQLSSYYQWLLGIIAIVFCSWIIYETPAKTILTASIFTLSGIPVYLFLYCKRGIRCA